MKEEQAGIKLRLPEEGLYIIFLERIASCKKPGKEIIRFPDVMEKIGRSFSLPKKNIFELLYIFKDLGLLDIICGHGVKINYEVCKQIMEVRKKENGSN